MRIKDREIVSRVLRAAAVSALFALFIGGLFLFTFHVDALATACTATMMAFWIFFSVLYVATVHKSAATLESEWRCRLEEQRQARATILALKIARRK